MKNIIFDFRPAEYGLDHIPDPIAKLVWEKWIAEGTARLIPSGNEVQGCRA
jgi:hypothetical protein